LLWIAAMKSIDSLSDAELIQRVRRALKDLPDAPLALQQAAIELWPTTSPLAALETVARAVARRIAAALTFDSWSTPAFAHGMRSMRSPTRHLVYNAMGRDIDLRITAEAEGFGIIGQVLGPDEAGVAELAAQDAPPAEVQRAPLDAFGEFRIEHLPAGSFLLTIAVGDDQIVLPPIKVGDCST
jgi:hypothetical protein